MSPFSQWWLRETTTAMALCTAGGCAGARIAGASVWIGLASVPLLILWLVLVVDRPGPNDPPGR